MTRDPIAAAATLAELPLLPREDAAPVFAEPWQAQAFAIVVELIEAGTITREEWAAQLGATFAEAEARGRTDTGSHYYDHWLTTLERIVIDKGLTAIDELNRERIEIRTNDHHRREHQLHGDHGHNHD